MTIFNEAQVLKDVLAFMQKAGDFAVQKQTTAKQELKADKSVVTEVDLAISKMAMDDFKSYFDTHEHVLIDEEFVGNQSTDVLNSDKYLWVLDPIDGTSGYAMGRDRWGIFLGIIYKGQPIFGVAYLPVTGKLAFTQNQQSFTVENAFTANETKQQVKCSAFKMSHHIYVETPRINNKHWGSKSGDCPIWPQIPESAVNSLMYLLNSQAAGFVQSKGFSLWDVVAAYALAKYAGFSIINMENDTVFKEFSPAFVQQNWKIAHHWVVCPQENYEYIKNAIQKEVA